MATVQQAADLLEHINWASTECVNASAGKPLENALKQARPQPSSLACHHSAHLSCKNGLLLVN